jgi:hypothetical protein
MINSQGYPVRRFFEASAEAALSYRTKSILLKSWIEEVSFKAASTGR